MKLIVILSFTLGLTWSYASVYSQGDKLTVHVKNMTIKDVLKQIEEQSEYSFMYNASKINIYRKVDINIKNSSVNDVLNEIFSREEVYFKFIDKNILLFSDLDRFTNIKIANQELAVKGKITDVNGNPLPGVNVVEKGTTNGAVTNLDGEYSISISSKEAILSFSYVGFLTEEMNVGGQTTIDMVLVEDIQSLEEVVVIGYSVQKKANLTGSVSTVSSQTIGSRPTTNPTNLLQGRIAGLQVTQPSGQPGRDDANFQIRGLGSFGASSSPLILVDGVTGSLSNLAPNDIESITVLKDAASASIYGSRAANGVILVTTKQAKEGAVVEYQFDMGIHSATRLPEVITNSAEYMEMYNSARERAGFSPLYTQEQIDAYRNATDRNEYPNFDWLDYYFNPATVMNHYLSLSNVKDKSAYKFSMNYLDQPGILPNIKYKKYNTQLNFTNQITESIKVGTNVNAVFKDNQEPPYWNDTDGVRYIYTQGPLYKPYLPDGSGRKTAWAYSSEPHNSNAPVAFDNGSRKTKGYGLNAQAYLDINLYKDLVWTVKAAVNYSDRTEKEHSYETQEHYYYHKLPGETDYTIVPTVSSVYQGIGIADTYTKSILPSIYSVLNYKTQIAANHNLKAMLGYEQQSYKYQFLEGSRRVFPTTTLMELDAGSADGQSVSGSSYEWALRSYFGRLAYDFQGKYLFEANARYDGTSRVAEAHRWGFFPSFSAGWRISEETFIGDNLSWMDNLKLRTSYGVLGNQEIGYYPYQDLLSLTSYPLDGSSEQGVLTTRLTDKNLKWESTKVFDVGMDLDIYNGLLGITFDWFKKKTYDILATQPVPLSLGLSGPTTNNGELQNIGWEMELRHRKQLGDWSYDVNFIVSAFKNELLSIVTETKGVNEVGLPYNSFYLYEMEGIFQSEEDIANSPDHIFYTPQPGDIKIKDQNGDKIINSDDRISISPYPDFTYSFGFNVGWKNFNLSTFFQGVSGLRTRVYGWGYDSFVEGDAPNVRFRDAWTPTNPSNTEPAVYIGSGSYSGGYSGVYGYPSTYHLPDASYLRLKNVNLSYTLPEYLVKKMRLQDLTIYFSGDNLLTFTDFPGIDPELPASTNRASAYPQVRILNLGLKVKF